MFERIPEPELMNDVIQVQAYADADFSVSHDRLIEQIAVNFPEENFAGLVLNLGCGSGDDAFRFLKRFPASRMLAVDGAQEMIRRAERDLITRHAHLSARIQFATSYIPHSLIPKDTYISILSNSLLHHLHQPLVLWNTIARHSNPGTAVFVADLQRPDSLDHVEQLVIQHAEGAPEILRRDFHNSLCAAFTLEEVNRQLEQAGLENLQVEAVGDRHMVVHGRL